MEGIKKAMNERKLNEGQWEDRKQWSLGVEQRRKTFRTRYINTYYINQHMHVIKYISQQVSNSYIYRHWLGGILMESSRRPTRKLLYCIADTGIIKILQF
jgi:hypothetical protein